jgi:hypothetical protein
VGVARNLALTVGLFLSGVLVVSILAWWPGPLDSMTKLLFAPHAENPPDELLSVVLALLAGASLARLPLPLPGWLDPLLGSLKRYLSRGKPLCGFLIAVLGTLAVASLIELFGAFDDGLWQKFAITTATITPLIVAGLTVTRWEPQANRDRSPG